MASRPGIKATTRSTCSYCGVGCGVIVDQGPNGAIHVTGDVDHPVNAGQLCSKGRYLGEAAQDRSDRLLFPEMRWNRAGQRQRVSWDTAMDRAAAVFRSIIERFGPDSVGFYVSGQLLTEEYYLVNKIAKGFIGTANVDTNSRLCMSSAVTSYKMTLGEDCVPCSYEDLDIADCFVLAGSNMAWCHPILFRRVLENRRKNPDTCIIVVDPRKTDTAREADIHLQINPGTDMALYHALARILMEDGGIDQAFVDNHTEGFEAFRDLVMRTSVADAASICGLEAAQIRDAAGKIKNARGFISCWAMGLNQSTEGVDRGSALIALNLLTGQIGRPGAGPFSLTGQPNAMGGREVGGLATMLAAHKELGRADHRQEVASFWQVPLSNIPSAPGLTAVEMFDALHSGKLRAIWIICTNPMVSMPDSGHIAAALSKARFVVVQDISARSDTIAYADLVLPAAGWLEKSGTMTNSERRISWLPQVLTPPGEARPDCDILIDFARRMGWRDSFAFPDVAAVYDEYVRMTHGTHIDLAALSHESLQAGTIQWPVADGSGTARLFEDHQFYTQSGRATLRLPSSQVAKEATDGEFPLVLTTGRTRDQWHTQTRTGKVARLRQHDPDPLLDIHTADAAEASVATGDLVHVEGRRGKVCVRARVTDDVPAGTVFLSMHWGLVGGSDGARANNLTTSVFDPMSKQPDLKRAAVRVAKAVKTRERIVIVGSGTAAYHFINAYRRENQRDEVVVVGEEPVPFYNRVLLPHYIGGTSRWNDLLFSWAPDISPPYVQLLSGSRAESLDLKEGVVYDSKGRKHAYDRLVFASGSRPRLPRGLSPSDCLTLRSRVDAHAIMRSAGKQALILGGGLLGIELADALRQAGSDVTIVHRGPHLMSRQLDETAGALLRRVLTDRGIKVLTSNEIIGVGRAGDIKVAYLASGDRIDCTSIVCALGTEPVTEPARAAGIRCGRGILVNERLETSVPNVSAIGECAEFRGQSYGNAAAASEQASILARVLAGEAAAIYKGSIESNVLKIQDYPLASVGSSVVPPGAECITYLDEGGRVYRRYIVQSDRLIGAIFAGDVSGLQTALEFCGSAVELGSDRARLSGFSKPTNGPVICACTGADTGAVLETISAGAANVDAVARATGAGSGCGSCRGEIARLLEANRASLEVDRVA